MRALFCTLLWAALVVMSAGSTATADPLKVAIVSRTVFYVPLWIADRLGFLREEGLDAAIQVYDNAERINSDLKSGNAHIAISTPESVVIDA